MPRRARRLDPRIHHQPMLKTPGCKPARPKVPRPLRRTASPRVNPRPVKRHLQIMPNFITKESSIRQSRTGSQHYIQCATRFCSRRMTPRRCLPHQGLPPHREPRMPPYWDVAASRIESSSLTKRSRVTGNRPRWPGPLNAQVATPPQSLSALFNTQFLYSSARRIRSSISRLGVAPESLIDDGQTRTMFHGLCPASALTLTSPFSSDT